MRASIIIASHNEGQKLRRTVESCLEVTEGLDRELIIADDASTDGSLGDLPPDRGLRVLVHHERRGASPTKDMGGRAARGETIVFLDGHCKPAVGALTQLVEDVEATEGQAIITPAVPALDVERWENRMDQVGHGYQMTLDRFDCHWTGLRDLARSAAWPRLYESPALIGCCLAIGRTVYERLRGFDADMRFWGLEDLDFGLKAWLMGHPVLHDPAVVVGHKFRARFDNYNVPMEHVIANKLRMARKNFTNATWDEWVDGCRDRLPSDLWDQSWRAFEDRRDSVEQERSYLLEQRSHDEFWFASRFGLDWPKAVDAV